MRRMSLAIVMAALLTPSLSLAKTSFNGFVPRSAQHYNNGTMIARLNNAAGDQIRIIRRYNPNVPTGTNQTTYLAVSKTKGGVEKAPVKLSYGEQIQLKNVLGKAWTGGNPTVPFKSLRVMSAMRLELPPTFKKVPLE